MIEAILLPKKSGVYIIKNNINNKVYVGSSKNIRGRITMHLSQLKRNIHCNGYLQYSFNKYGAEAFSVDVLIACLESDLIKYEEFYIKKYKSSENKYGYNLDSFENGRNKKFNVQRGENRKNAKANYSVVRIIRGLYVKGKRPYIKEIAEVFGISVTVTKNIINKVKWIVLDFEDLTNEEKIKIQEIKNIFDGKEYRKHLFNKITLTHKQTNEVLCFESIDSCGRYFGMHSGGIRESLKRPNSRINKIYTIQRQTNPRNSRQNKGGRMQWISVKERLPIDNEEVLIVFKWFDIPVQAYWNGSTWKASYELRELMKDGYCNDSTLLMQEDIYAWMPLPSPPKTETK